jgi:hypothetical protein
MSYALARGTRWEPAPADDESWHQVRTQTQRDFEATYGRRAITPQLDGITAVRRWLHGAIAVEKANGQTGRTIHRSWAQMFLGVARDLDWHLHGPRRQIHARYCNQVKRRLDHLVDIGDLEAWEPVYNANQESTGILLRVPAGVAQSVRPARIPRRFRRPGQVAQSARQLARRGLAERPRARRSAELSSPFGTTSRSGSSVLSSPPAGDERAAALVREAAAACPPRLRGQLRRLTTALVGWPRRPRGVLAAAAGHGASPVVVALAAWELATDGRPPQLSAAWRTQLERSAQQFDRLHGPGRAALWLAQRIDGLGDDELIEERSVRSLAYYAHQLKQTARADRRARRRAGKPRPWRSRRPEASSW